MALSIVQILGLTGLAVGSGLVTYRSVKQVRDIRGRLGVPSCGEGLTPRLVDGSWQCLPVTAFEECLQGIVIHDRVPLPADIEATLSENARKTAAQFFGFHLSPEAMREAWTALMQKLAAGEEEEAYPTIMADLMPCTWPIWAPGEQPAPGFTNAPQEQLAGWPMDFNYYLDPPPGVSDRMEKGARSLFDLFIVAAAQTMDQFLPIDVDPIALVSDPDLEACARGDVLGPRDPGIPTSETVILGAISIAGYEPQSQNVDEVMATLEAENPLLIAYLESDWRVSAEIQDRLWQVLLDVASFPRPVTNTVYNVQTGSCPWDDKDQYSLSMATLWYAAKRLAAIAELSGSILPVVTKEG